MGNWKDNRKVQREATQTRRNLRVSDGADEGLTQRPRKRLPVEAVLSEWAEISVLMCSDSLWCCSLCEDPPTYSKKSEHESWQMLLRLHQCITLCSTTILRSLTLPSLSTPVCWCESCRLLQDTTHTHAHTRARRKGHRAINKATSGNRCQALVISGVLRQALCAFLKAITAQMCWCWRCRRSTFGRC